MPREYGRVESFGGARYDPRNVPTAGTKGAVKWRAIAYKGKGESKLGEYDTRQEAVDALQAHIRKGKQR